MDPIVLIGQSESWSTESISSSSNHIKWSAGNMSVTISSGVSSSAEAKYTATPPDKCNTFTAGNRWKNGSHSVKSISPCFTRFLVSVGGEMTHVGEHSDKLKEQV